ncbi:MAG: hypothetical protein JRG82_18420 [Deltaproteobacteria bacterium]|nr:hypothetical protein [Deltaproteobacteria bacterium]
MRHDGGAAAARAQRARGGPALYGYLVGAYGVGNVASNLAIIWRPLAQRTGWMFLGGIIWGVGMLAVGLAPNVPLALLACAFAAIGGPLTDVIRAFLIQTEFPPDQVGKVYSLRMVVSRASHGAGLLLAAPLFAWTDVRTAIGGAGSVLAVVGLLALVATARGTPRPR